MDINKNLNAIDILYTLCKRSQKFSYQIFLKSLLYFPSDVIDGLILKERKKEAEYNH